MHLFTEEDLQMAEDLARGQINNRGYSYFMREGEIKLRLMEGLLLDSQERKNHKVTAHDIRPAVIMNRTYFWPMDFQGKLMSSVTGKTWYYEFEASIQMTEEVRGKFMGIDDINWNSNPAVHNFIKFVQSFIAAFIKTTERQLIQEGVTDALVRKLFAEFRNYHFPENNG